MPIEPSRQSSAAGGLPPEVTTTEALIERLAAGLRPVRPRRFGVDAAMLAALYAIELVSFLAVGAARSDLSVAMGLASFWWKLISLGLIAFLGAVMAIVSFSPVVGAGRGWRWLAVLVAICLGADWLIEGTGDGGSAFWSRLDWREGISCVGKIVALSLPAVCALGVMMKHGAPVAPEDSALAVGVAAAAWGAFVFVFDCPHDDGVYIAVWYSLGCGIVTLLARLLLPPLTRW